MGANSSKAASGGTNATYYALHHSAHRIKKPPSRPLRPLPLQRRDAVRHPNWRGHPTYALPSRTPPKPPRKDSPMRNFHTNAPRRPSLSPHKPSLSEELKCTALQIAHHLSHNRDCRALITSLSPVERGRVRAMLHLADPRAFAKWPSEDALVRFRRDREGETMAGGATPARSFSPIPGRPAHILEMKDPRPKKEAEVQLEFRQLERLRKEKQAVKRKPVPLPVLKREERVLVASGGLGAKKTVDVGSHFFYADAVPKQAEIVCPKQKRYADLGRLDCWVGDVGAV